MNPILDEINRLSPEAQQALKLAGTNAAAVAAQPALDPAPKPAMLTPPKAGPAPMMAPGIKPASIQAEAGKMPTVAPPKMALSSPAPTPGMGVSLTPPKPAPGTLEANQAERDRMIGSGSGISQVKNPFLRGLGHAGEFLGTVATNLIPGMHGAMSVVPGTEQHHNLLVARENREITQQESERKSQAQQELERAQASNAAAQPGIREAQEQGRNDRAEATLHSQLAQHGFKQDENGHIVPLSYEEMSEDQKAVHDLKASQQELNEAKKALTEAQKSNMPVQIQMAQQRIATAQQNASVAAAKLGLQKDEFERDTFGTNHGEEIPGAPQIDGKTVGFKTAATHEKTKSSNRQDVREHDKAYVQPAEAVEKSYQMMNQAYDEYKQAKAAGKDLPTGAQSMLALSTHLSTTFGNVKGARITKDMIEHHLGARGISDGAVVAVQKLTNGDVLSPAQWEAFHGLIKQSRDLSWKTAVKEAERKHIPVDFLPEDLAKGATSSGTAAAAGPKVGDVEAGHRFKGGDPSDPNNWETVGKK